MLLVNTRMMLSILSLVETSHFERQEAFDSRKLLQSLTNGYSPLSTCTILRRIVELYLIARPLLATFFSSLNVAISLTLDGWSNRNLKGFYVVTAHWIDIVTAKSKSLLLTIIDVASGHGVGVRVAKDLFENLKGI